MKYSYNVKFSKEFKKLSKKYKSLPKDFEKFLLVLSSDPCGTHILGKSVERITIKESWTYFKVRKFICQSISRDSSNSGIRLVYKYFDNQTIEFEEIEFIEMYHKNDRTNHDETRLL